MKRVRRKKADKGGSTSDNERRRGHSSRESFSNNLLDAWAAKAERERFGWLNRPRLHTAIFEETRCDEELERLIATKRAAFKNETVEARRTTINKQIEAASRDSS